MSTLPDPAPIRLVGLTLGYDRHPAVHHLDGTVRAGDLLALVGPNGAGKSTLLKGMAGEIRCLDGRIERAGAIAYMPQADEIDRSFPLSVLDLAGMGLWRRAGVWRGLNRHRGAIEAALAAGATRLRPVMMTALAMIIGMAPMAIEPGQNAPLGRAVIGGLLFATLATLFFVPVVFSIVHGRPRRVGAAAPGPSSHSATDAIPSPSA